jgi:hypothetical protein
VFEGITPGQVAYVRARGYERSAAGLTFELGGPWAFYRQFWPAHNIERLAELYAPEAQVAPGESLWVPLLIHNDTDSATQITLRPSLPTGWKEYPETTVFDVAAHDSYAVQLTTVSSNAQKGTWQNLSWEADGDGKTINTVTLRVKVESNGLPQ